MFDPRALGIGKFGRNGDVDAAEDIWSLGGTYTFAAGAEVLYVSNANTGDTTQQIRVTGLDAQGLEVTDTKTLSGRTGVALDGTWLRVYRASVVGDVVLTGDTYIGTEASPTVGVPALANTRAHVPAAGGQTLMAITTVPAQVGRQTIRRGYIADMLLVVVPGSPAGVQVEFGLYARSPGGVFVSKSSLGLTDDQPTLYRPFPKAIELLPLTDVKLRVDSVSAANVKVSGEFAIFYE
jgi:hypothetical protein